MVLITNWVCWVKDHIKWAALRFLFRLNCSLLSRLTQGHGDQVLHSSFPSWHNWGHRGWPLPDFHWAVPGFTFPWAGSRRNWHNSWRQCEAQPEYLHPALIMFLPASSSQRDHIPILSTGVLQLCALWELRRVAGYVLALTCTVVTQYDQENMSF